MKPVPVSPLVAVNTAMTVDLVTQHEPALVGRHIHIHGAVGAAQVHQEGCGAVLALAVGQNCSSRQCMLRIFALVPIPGGTVAQRSAGVAGGRNIAGVVVLLCLLPLLHRNAGHMLEVKGGKVVLHVLERIILQEQVCGAVSHVQASEVFAISYLMGIDTGVGVIHSHREGEVLHTPVHTAAGIAGKNSFRLFCLDAGVISQLGELLIHSSVDARKFYSLMKQFDKLHVNPITLTSKDKVEILFLRTLIHLE